MKTRGVIALAVLLAGLPQPGQADDCSDMTQSAMNQCAGETYETADAELNAKYQEIRQRLPGNDDARALLTAAQRNWIAYRDAECKFSSASVQGGSIYPTIYANCLETITRSRIGDFDRYLACEEGDLDCPVPAGN